MGGEFKMKKKRKNMYTFFYRKVHIYSTLRVKC